MRLKICFTTSYLFLVISYLPAPFAQTSENDSHYSNIFPEIKQLRPRPIPDPINDKPVNTEIIVAYNKEQKIIGFIREVTTSTGCHSECLPVIFTLYYGHDGTLKTVNTSQKNGLTKKYHLPFNKKDMAQLEIILMENPSLFETVKEPREMVDAFSGATKSEYVPFVVKEAAFTTLRVNLYHQQTLKFIKDHFSF